MIVKDTLRIHLDELRRSEWKKLLEAMTYVADDGEIVEPWRHLVRHRMIELPRGAWSLLPDHIEYEDLRTCPKTSPLDFKVELDAVLEDGRTFHKQKDALKSMLANEQGLLIRPPGTGKTQIALAFIAECQTRTLVLVHTEDILQQWVEYARKAIPKLTIGIVRASERTVGHLTVATVQTARGLTDDPAFLSQFGCVILDEAHHGPAKTFEIVLNHCPAKYRFGFTATNMRADGHHPYMKLLIGPVIHRHKLNLTFDVSVTPITTDFRFRFRGPWDWTSVADAIEYDKDRNRLIAKYADRDVSDGRSTLILSRRIAHLHNIRKLMKSDARVLTGEVKKEERKQMIHDFRSGKLKCLLATQLADEALDVPILSSVHLTFPGKSEGGIVQKVGRALREHPDKDSAVVRDYVDSRVSVLRRQWFKRRAAYRKMKLSIRKEGRIPWL